MPKYILVRTVGEVSEEEMEAAAKRSIEALEQMPDVRWIRSYYSSEEGKLMVRGEPKDFRPEATFTETGTSRPPAAA